MGLSVSGQTQMMPLLIDLILNFQICLEHRDEMPCLCVPEACLKDTI